MQILFVCTGNTCRSPMAEVYARECLRKVNRDDISSLSAGLAAFSGDTASVHAIELMASIGLNLGDFRSRRVSRLLLEEADWVVVMGQSHFEAIKSLMPDLESKLTLLLESSDVPDPYGGDLNRYKDVFEVMRPAIERFINKIILK